MSKYLDRISQSKETQSEAQLAGAEKQAKLAVQGAINQAQQSALKNEEAYEFALGTNPFNVGMVLKAQKEKQAIADELTSLNTILTDQF